MGALQNHAVYQDRFVKELKLRGIQTVEEANNLLLSEFIDKLNEKFAKEPLSQEDGHSPLLDTNLAEILVWRYQRQLQNDWTISFMNKQYQIVDSKSKLRAKQTVEVIVDLEGKMKITARGEKLEYRSLEPMLKVKQIREKKGYSEQQRTEAGRKGGRASPWRQYNPNWIKGHHKGDIIGLRK